MIRAVIVDFDDTLCMTEEACFELENAVLGQMGLPSQSREVHVRTWGQPLFEAIKERASGVDVNTFQRLIIALQAEWVATGRIDAIAPANLQALDALLHEGKEIFVLTSRTKPEVVHLLEPDHELATRIKTFYYRDIMPYHKPDPRAFDGLLHDHQLKPEECVYVGDSPSDAAAAKGARLHFIASLEAGLRTRKDFADYPVDAFVSSFADLPAAVRALAAQ